MSVMQNDPVEVYSYAWSPDRDHFSPRHRHGDSFKSRKFCSHKTMNIQWVLHIYPHGRTDPNFVSVYLELLPQGKAVVAKCKFAFLSYAGTEIIADGLAEFRCTNTMTHFSDLYGYDMGEHDFGANNKCGADRSVNQFFILYGMSRTRHAPLTTCCEITLVSSEWSGIKIPASCLAKDLGVLLANGAFFDVTLTTVPHKATPTLPPDHALGVTTAAMALKPDASVIHNIPHVFHAHKAILCARSQVFKAMFAHDLQERQYGHVVIADMSNKALEGLLQFIYTGTVKGMDGQVEELLAAAEKYALQRLKVMCEHCLARCQTKENITHILLLADLYNASNLRTHAIEFVKRNSNEVLNTTAWKLFTSSRPELAIEILMDVARTK